MSKPIRMTLPSKGHLQEGTLEFLEDCGLRVKKPNPRQYSATIPALPGVEVLFQRPRDIPRSVAAGDIDLGITGYDTVAEILGEDDERIVLVHEALGYGECALVLAVPMAWDDVDTLADLGERSAAEGLRVATKYNRAVTRFFERARMNNIRIVYADGALEAAPSIGYADFIADVTSSGTTLRENNLRPIEGGTIVESQAVFIANRAALHEREDLLAVSQQILELFEANLNAKGQYMLFANIRGESPEEVSERLHSQPDLGGLQWPTIAPLLTGNAEQGNWWAVNLVTPQHRLYAAIQQLRAVGGSGVVVTPVTYIFDEFPARAQRLLQVIEKENV